ncbi:MAG: acylphosphatase [Methylomonas sp.]
MSETLHIFVKGRVQGVYFRANTQKQALKLNLKGLVRNLPDNSVEIIAQGDTVALQQLITWCYKGPLLARVSEVIVSPYHQQDKFSDFQIA